MALKLLTIMALFMLGSSGPALNRRISIVVKQEVNLGPRNNKLGGSHNECASTGSNTATAPVNPTTTAALTTDPQTPVNPTTTAALTTDPQAPVNPTTTAALTTDPQAPVITTPTAVPTTKPSAPVITTPTAVPTTKPSVTTLAPTTADAITSKLRAGCYEDDGFFVVAGSGNQSFKFFPDSHKTWEASKLVCQAEGLELAKPDDPATAVALRKFILERYGDKRAWLGAQGTGSSRSTGTVKWDRDGTTLFRNNSAWRPHQPHGSTSTDDCLFLLVHEGDMNRHPTEPYSMFNCSDTNPMSGSKGWLYPLCELTSPFPTTAEGLTPKLPVTAAAPTTAEAPTTKLLVTSPAITTAEALKPKLPAGCHKADGFFEVTESGNQCFKFFPDSHETWEASKLACQSEGLELAKPDDLATAVALKIFIKETYGSVRGVWLGARGTGSSHCSGSMEWVRDGTTVSSNNSFWIPYDDPSSYTTTSDCLALLLVNDQATQSYLIGGCIFPIGLTLCELVI